MAAVDYAKLDYQRARHHVRFKAYVESLTRRYVCPLCGGRGGHVEVVDPVLGGPWYECELCEGLGETTPWLWSIGMQIRKQERRR